MNLIPKEELSSYENVHDTDLTFGDPEIISQTTKCLGMKISPKTHIFNCHSYEE